MDQSPTVVVLDRDRPVAKTTRRPSRKEVALQRMRAGTYGRWRGVDVIGTPGVAVMYGYYRSDGVTPAEQSVRALARRRPGFPAPRFVVRYDGRNYNLYSREAMLRYGEQIGLIDPVTGAPKRRRRT